MAQRLVVSPLLDPDMKVPEIGDRPCGRVLLPSKVKYFFQIFSNKNQKTYLKIYFSALYSLLLEPMEDEFPEEGSEIMLVLESNLFMVRFFLRFLGAFWGFFGVLRGILWETHGR